jgi:hypothetical protein
MVIEFRRKQTGSKAVLRVLASSLGWSGCLGNDRSSLASAEPGARQKAESASALSSPSASRAPAYPLITSDPYFSIWAFTDRLTDDWTRHWTGAVHAMESMVRIDGATYRLMGPAPEAIPAMPQTAVRVHPTRTVYDFAGSGIELSLEFLSPLLAHDLEVTSRPASYLTFRVRATDGRKHAVSLYFDNSGELVVNRSDQQVIWGRTQIPGLLSQKMGSRDQPILAKSGEDRKSVV